MTLRDIKRAHYAKADQIALSKLGKAAERYARHGLAVFPLRPGTKEPATTRGLNDATTDPKQIRRWWKANPRYNIGINCGASGLLVVDADTYKTNAGAVDLPPTVEAHTAHHGTHYWYKMPAGKRYGNASGTLPKWLDIRGHGGYVVAPPSVFIEDGVELPYTFAPGRKPTVDIALADLPDLPSSIAIILEAAQAAAAAVPVNFSAGVPVAPNLAQWALSDEVLALIHDGHPAGADRSSGDQKVITALIYVGADDDAIRGVFVHYPVGAKYQERGRGGDRYLAYSIGKARAYVEDHPPGPPAARERLLAARAWVRSPACLDHLRAQRKEDGTPLVRRVADLVPTLDALIEMVLPRRTSRLATTVRDVADSSGVAAATAHRRLKRLAEAGLLALDYSEYGTVIDFDPLLALSETLSRSIGSVGVVSLGASCEEDFFAEHRTDDAFTSYPYAYAIKRRQAPTVLMQSLGASGLLLWDALLGGGTIKDLAAETGLTESAIRVTLKRFNQAGLLIIWQEGRAKVYELHPNAWERLEERREHMVTAGIGQLRAARNAGDRATFAQRKLQGRMPLEPREKMKLENRRAKADDKAAAYYHALQGMGIDPFAKVRHRQYARTNVHADLATLTVEELAALDPDPTVRLPRPTMRVDHAEEWVSMHQPIYDQWQRLSDLRFAERYRVMGYAGWTREQIDSALRIATHRGRPPQEFAGVGQPAAA